MIETYQSTIGTLTQRWPMLRLALMWHRLPSTEASGKAPSLVEFPFLCEPYAEIPDLHDVVVQKCTQVGWTEMVLMLHVVQAGERGRRVCYALPDDGMVRTFVQERVLPMLDRSATYRSMMRADWRAEPAKNVKLRHFGNGSWRFIGVRQSSALREFTADTMIIDEFDECEQRHLPLAKDRIRASNSPQMIRMGNPTLRGQGIAALYEASDQRRWYHECSHCGTRQPIDWFTNVVEKGPDGRPALRDKERALALHGRAPEDVKPAEDIRPICRDCAKPFDRHVRCRWTAENPGHYRRGYHLSQMDVPARTIWSLWHEFREAEGNPTKMRIFFSSGLGLPFEESGARINAEDIRNAMRDYETDYAGGPQYEKALVTCGIDVGAVLHCRVSVIEERHEDPSDEDSPLIRVRRAVWIGTLPDFEAVHDVLERYSVKVCVFDADPETHSVRQMRDRYRGQDVSRVWMCRFHQTPTLGTEQYGMRLNEEESSVMCDRTALLDTSFRDLRQGMSELPMDVLSVLGFEKQMCAPVRKLSKDGTRYVWDEDGKADHFRLCDAYDRVALDIHDRSAGGYYEIDLDDLS